MKRLLVLGGAGMLGHKVWQTLRRQFDDVHVTLRKPRGFYSGMGLFADGHVIERLDVTDQLALHAVLDEIKPDVICNCIGLTLRKQDEVSAESYILLNSLLPHQLNTWCARNGKRLIHISTDCVFSGESGPYEESSLPDARDLYGRSKLLGEVQSAHALVLRTSIVGRELMEHTELLEWFLRQEGKTVHGYRQAMYTGVTTNFLARVIAQVIEKHESLNGIYQVASSTISKYELLRKVRDCLKLNIDLVAEDQHVSKKILLGGKFVQATGIRTPSWDEMIEEIRQDKTLYQTSKPAGVAL